MMENRVAGAQANQAESVPQLLSIENGGVGKIDGWRPIETAPEDGTPVWTYGEAGIAIASFKKRWNWRLMGYDCFWETIFAPDGIEKECAVSHWMPLPGPPVEERPSD